MKKIFLTFFMSLLTFNLMNATGDNSLRSVLKQRQPGAAALKHSGIKKAPVTILPSQTSKRGPALITQGGATLNGWLTFSDDPSLVSGFYEFNEQGFELKWEDFLYPQVGLSLQAAWINDNRLCGYANQILWGILYASSYVEFDLESGDIVDENELDVYTNPFLFQTAAFNESEGIVYGYGLMHNNQKYFMAVHYSTPEDPYTIKQISDDEFCTSLCYNKYEDALYGINLNHDFVRIDSDGNQDVIFHIDLENIAPFATGLAYNPQESLYYWNMIYTDNSGCMATIDQNEGVVNVYESLPYGDQFYTLFCLDDRFNEKRPARPVFKNSQFEDGNTTGSVTFTMPSKFMGGKEITGELQYNAYLDGEVYKSGTAGPGAQVTVEFTDITQDMHVFGMSVEVDGVESSIVTTRFYVGNDIPATPQNVTLTKTSVTWDKVTRGIHNGYLDLSALEYEVFLNGESYGLTKDTKMEIFLPDDVEWTLFNATVRAICNGMESALSYESNGVPGGKAMSLPVHFAPTYEEFQLMTVVNANNDYAQWYWVDIMEGPCAVSGGYSDQKMDDWLFLPPIYFDSADKVYTFSITSFAWDNPYNGNYLEVLLCDSDSPESVLSTIMEPFEPGTNPENYESVIKVAQPGSYYVAFHCTSEPWDSGVLVQNISISDNSINNLSPEEVSDISVTAAENGVLEANVSFTLPVKNISGDYLEPDITLTVYVEGAETVIVSSNPGSHLSVTVPTIQGENAIRITVSDGVNNSVTSIVSVYTGVDVPRIVDNLSATVSEDMLEMTLTWDIASTGESGGYINPTDIVYDIYRYEETYIGYSWMLYASDVKANSFIYTLLEEEEQQVVQLGVMSKNEAGSNNKIVVVEGIMGTPYELPLNEMFDNYNNFFTYNPWVEYNPSDEYVASQWSLYYLQEIDPSYPFDKVGLIALTSQPDTKALLGMPRFITKDKSEVTLELTVYNTQDLPKIMIYCECYGSERYEVGEIKVKDEYGLVKGSITLPEALLGKDWVQLYIEVAFSSPAQFLYINEVNVEGVAESGVESIYNVTRINSGKGEIRLESAEGLEYSIFTIDGQNISQGVTTQASTVINVNKGAYVVKLGKSRKTVIVK